MDSNIKVIIVEDNSYLRESIVEFLNFDGLDACGAENCLAFYQALAASSFAVAVVDIGLPDQSGFMLAEYIRKNTGIGIIMLTARDAMEDRVRGYDSGADLYMVKPVDCRELAAAIRSLAARLGERPTFPERKSGPQSWRLIRESWHLLSPEGIPISLTAREMAFLVSLAEGAGRPIRRDAMLIALGYRDDAYARRAMDAMVRRVRRKIEEIANQESPIKTVHSVGYCFSASIVIC